MKKLTIALLTLVLVLAMLPISVFADATSEVIGYSSARIEHVNMGHIKNITSIPSHASFSSLESAYKITDVDGFYKLSEMVNQFYSFQNITIYLANDVDFTDKAYIPIGNSVNSSDPNTLPLVYFNGTFDGQGNVITGLTVKQTESNGTDAVNYGGVGLFGVLVNATVKNLIIGDDCLFEYTADPGDHGCAGAIAHTAWDSVIDNCWNAADVLNSSRFSAGMVGRQLGELVIINCTNSGKIKACQNAAGMVGFSAAPLVVFNCRNTGEIVSNLSQDTNGAQVGSDNSAAGIVSWILNHTYIERCINNGDIMGCDNVGGIAGQIGNDNNTIWEVYLFDCINYGNLKLENAKTQTNDDPPQPNTPVIAAEGSMYAESVLSTDPTLDNNWDQRGQTDATLVLETIVPDYTVEPDHIWNDGVITKAPTHLETGIKTFSCDQCDEVKTEPVAKLPEHTYIYRNLNELYHQKVCQCGDVEYICHTWDAGEVTREATHLVAGTKVLTCTECNAEKTDTIAKLPDHTYTDWTNENETHHKKECACGDIQREDHQWNDGEIITEASHLTVGEKRYTCSGCGATKTEEIAKLTEHTYQNWENHDAVQHKIKCACGDTRYADHVWEDAIITVQPTYEAVGQKTYTCRDCDATKTKEIEKLNSPATTAPNDEEKNGCTSTILGGSAMIALLGGTALVLLRKKKNKI